MYRILHFLFGYIRIKISGKLALQSINILYAEGFPFWGMEATDDGYFISCSVSKADSIVERLEENGSEYEIQKRAGLSFLLYPYRHRIGLLVGLVLGMAIIYASTTVLWDVRLECNGEYDETEVMTQLEKLGVRCGAPIKNINVYNTELGFLINNPRFSDIALNVQGTVAVVKLRVRTKSPKQEEKTGAYDVVASESGIIRSVTATEGKPTVKKGDTVNAGDLLISGTVQGAYGEYYLYHAYGSVKAIVYRDFSVTVPLKTTEKLYTGKTETKVSLEVLGKSFDGFFSEFTEFEKADVVTSTKKISLWGVALPMEKHTLTYKEYVISEETISVKEAEKRANTAFEAYIKRELTGEVMNTETECTYSKEQNAVILNGTVELLAEIGKEVPITVFPETAPQKQ